jgi:hypothetical protein
MGRDEVNIVVGKGLGEDTHAKSLAPKRGLYAGDGLHATPVHEYVVILGAKKPPAA